VTGAHDLTTRAGMPAASEQGGTSRVTTAPAAMTAPRPDADPGGDRHVVPEQPSPTVIVPPIAFSQHPEPNHVPVPIVMSRSPSSRSGGRDRPRPPSGEAPADHQGEQPRPDAPSQPVSACPFTDVKTSGPPRKVASCLLVTGSGNHELAGLGPEGTSGLDTVPVWIMRDWAGAASRSPGCAWGR
jgi:hypothetical protein